MCFQYTFVPVLAISKSVSTLLPEAIYLNQTVVSKHVNKVTAAGLIVALGIIYGDIGTSPLYVFNAIINGKQISELLITGGLSCIIWTLTLQTTIKYVILTLRADNKGEGGIFSLYTLVRRQKKMAGDTGNDRRGGTPG